VDGVWGFFFFKFFVFRHGGGRGGGGLRTSVGIEAQRAKGVATKNVRSATAFGC